MGTAIQTVIGLFALVLLFVPAILVIYAGLRVRREIGGSGPIYILAGSLLLSLTSLDFLGQFLVSILFGPGELASYAVMSVYVVKAMNYVGLLSIGIGLLLLSRQLRTNPVLNAE